MKIKLISPKTTMRPMDSEWKKRMAPPLSLLVLGALTPPEHEVVLADENVERLRTDDTPDLVGITVKVDTAERARAIASIYRSRGIPVVAGGIHATACPESCSAFADCVVVGEAETTWTRLLNDLQQGILHKVYRCSEALDPSLIPIPRWDLLRSNRYLFTNTIRIGRGCPWRCDFCYNSSPNVCSGYRMKPIPAILEEIESLGVRHVMFIDDNFIGSLPGVRALLREMKPMGLTWHAAVSADIGKHESILDLMAETGCRSLFIGFESVNQQNLLKCHKPQNRIAEYDETIARIHERGMMVNASLVFGFDGDTTEIFPATLDWLIGNRVSTMTSHILTPYPGTKLHSRLRRENRIVDEDLQHYDTAHAVFTPSGMSAGELETGYRSIYSQFYSRKNIFRRMPTCREQGTAYLQFNLVYRKFGHITSLIGSLMGMRNVARLAKAMAYPAARRRTEIHGTSEKTLPPNLDVGRWMLDVRFPHHETLDASHPRDHVFPGTRENKCSGPGSTAC